MNQTTQKTDKFTTNLLWITENSTEFLQSEEYMTVIYKVVKSPDDTYENIEYKEGYDEVIFYKNGAQYGFAYYDHAVYEEGLKVWNKNDCPFFIGACPWNGNSHIYYLDGFVYCTRLYEKALTSTEVNDNYLQTLTYRNRTGNIN